MLKLGRHLKKAQSRAEYRPGTQREGACRVLEMPGFTLPASGARTPRRRGGEGRMGKLPSCKITAQGLTEVWGSDQSVLRDPQSKDKNHFGGALSL